jgi:hypothetical protein
VDLGRAINATVYAAEVTGMLMGIEIAKKSNRRKVQNGPSGQYIIRRTVNSLAYAKKLAAFVSSSTGSWATEELSGEGGDRLEAEMSRTMRDMDVDPASALPRLLFAIWPPSRFNSGI